MMRLIPNLLKTHLPQIKTTSPKPRLLEGIYQRLAGLLPQAFRSEQSQASAYSCDAEMRALDRESLRLAIARYMKEHPHIGDIPIPWLDFEQLSKWLAMSTAKLEYEAAQRLEQLERWDKFAKANHPDVWEAYRIRYIHVLLNLQSAYSGLFPSAMGNLAIFLDAVGASFEEIHLH